MTLEEKLAHVVTELEDLKQLVRTTNKGVMSLGHIGGICKEQKRALDDIAKELEEVSTRQDGLVTYMSSVTSELMLQNKIPVYLQAIVALVVIVTLFDWRFKGGFGPFSFGRDSHEHQQAASPPDGDTSPSGRDINNIPNQETPTPLPTITPTSTPTPRPTRATYTVRGT